MKLLLVRAGALGDLVLLRRTIAAARRAGHSVSLLAPSGPASAIRGDGLADAAEVLAWESGAFSSLFAAGADPGPEPAAALRAFDAAIAYTRDATLASGLRRLIPRVAVHDPAPPANGAHASEWLAAALPAVGIEEPTGEVPLLVANGADQLAAAAFAAALPPRFTAIHPGSGSRRKNWPAERFAEVARRLCMPWLLVSGPADDEAAGVLSEIPGAVSARGLPPRVLAALLARAAVYLGNDSGVTHLAAAAGPPTVALFGATDPSVWAPIGPRVRVLHCGGAMDAASVDTVRAAVDEWRRD